MSYSKGHSIDSGNFTNQNSKSLQKVSAISLGLLLLFTIPLMDSAFAGAAPPPNTIPVGVAPGGLIIVEPLKSVYVTNQGSASISVIDIDPSSPTENEVIQTIPVGIAPHNLIYIETPTTKLLYVSDNAGAAVPIIDLDPANVATFNTVIGSIGVGIGPFDLDFNPNTKKLYIANSFSNTVSAIDVDSSSPTFNTVVNTIPVGTIPADVDVNENTNLIYAGNIFSGTISVIDGTDDSVIDTISTTTPGGMMVDHNTNNLLVGNIFAAPPTMTVFDIDPSSPTYNQVITTVPVGNQPGVPHIHASDELIFVPNFIDGTLTIIDLNTFDVIGALPVNPSPFQVMAIDENTNLIYISHQLLDFVSIVDLEDNFPPTANAGIDQTVNEGDNVDLDGSNSSDFDGDPITFLWSQTDGPMVTLDDVTSETPSFTAPDVDGATIFTFQLIVNDGTFDSLPSFVNVVVLDTTIFTVPLVASGGELQGDITIESVPADSPLTFLLETPALGPDEGALDQAQITTAVPGSDVLFDFTVRQDVPPKIPKVLVKENIKNPALYFEIDVDGIDLGNPNNLPDDSPARTKFFVSKDYVSDATFPDGSPIVPFQRLNEKTGFWEQLGDPLLPNSNRLYVVDTTNDEILVVDASSNQIVTTISGGGIVDPADTVVVKSANKVYVYNTDGAVPVIDIADNSIITVIPQVQAGGFDPLVLSNERVYLGSSAPGKLNVIDTTTDRIVGEINHGITSLLPTIQHIPSLERLFIPDTLTQKVVVVDTTTNGVIGTIQLPSGSSDIHFDSTTNLLYLTLFQENKVAVIDAVSLTLVDTIPVGIAPVGIRINESTNKIFTADAGSGTVSVIDANVNVVIGTIPLQPGILGLEINKNTDRVFVVNNFLGTMSIIDGSTLTLLGTVPLQPGIFTIDAFDSVPNPVRDPACDTATHFAYTASTDHLSKFAIGGIKALAIGALATGLSDTGTGSSSSSSSSAPTVGNISFDGVTPVVEDGIIEFGGTIVDEIEPVNNLPTQTAEVGKHFEITIPLTLANGAQSLEHASIYLLRDDDETIYDSKTGITYETNSPVEYINSQDFISDVTVESIIQSANKIELTYGMTFNFPTEEGEILTAIFRSWDKYKHSSDIVFENFLQVVESTSLLPTDTSSEDTSKWSKSVESTAIKSTTVFKEEFDGTLVTFDMEEGQSITNNFKIPKWIKYNADWWSQDEIGEDDFVDGMKYLIDHKVIVIPQNHRVSILEPIPEVMIPEWVKNNASWWADDLLTDQEFVKAIEWLIEKGVITV